MTVYKPIKKLADKAADIAVAMAKKQPLTDKTTTVNNGKKDVPSILLEPIEVDKDQHGFNGHRRRIPEKRRSL